MYILAILDILFLVIEFFISYYQYPAFVLLSIIMLRFWNNDIHPSKFIRLISKKNYQDSVFFSCFQLHSHLSMSLNQESLWNPAVMLLSPQQRLVPFRTDMWTRLWDLLSTNADLVRFKPTTVADKLMVSLVCYQVSFIFFFHIL